MLQVSGLHAYYDKSHVLTGLDLRVAEGEIVCVLGRNGSGRSTALKTIMGLVPPTSGSVRLRSVELAGLDPFRIARAGIGYVPEERLVVDNLTVEENLLLGMKGTTGGTKTWTVGQMYDYFPQLRERMSTKAGYLSGGEQQMLTLCRSLLGHPDLLMIDEPTEGLAPKIVEHLLDVIRDINRSGVSMIIVEQKMMIALRLVQRCYIIGHGRVVFEGSPDTIAGDSNVRRKWLEVA